MNNHPYVVSEDIQVLLREWAGNRGFVLPEEGFFHSLRDELGARMRGMFQGCDLVSEYELTDGIARLVRGSGLSPLSLDRAYYRSQSSLDITRLVDLDGNDKGLVGRPETPSLINQFVALKERRVYEVVLVDDVVFSGDVADRVIKLLAKIGIQVPIVVAGIGIREGVERLTDLGKEVHCVRTYGEVIDEVCERDFFPGVPLSGRLLSKRKNMGIPYILPFGNPHRWASIPIEHEKPFSRFCIEQTVLLFKEIEKTSAKEVRCRDLGRRVAFLPGEHMRYVDVLERFLL